MEYAVALASSRWFANDVLQPVFLRGAYDHEARQNMTKEEFAKSIKVPPNSQNFVNWIQSKGGIVVDVPELTFQELITEKLWGRYFHARGMMQGILLRLDIPDIIEQNGLFDLPGICPQHVIYTDSDVIFANPVSHADIHKLKRQMAKNKDAILS